MNGYKYRANIAVNDKGNLRDIETLIKDELWASSLTDLNDPFEATYIDNIERALALFESVFGANIKDVKKYWEELILFKNHCCPEKFYHKVGCSTEPASGTQTGVVG